MKYSRAVLSEQRGVTFVEVLIVLAIISLMFAVSLTLLQNYVGQESFRSSVQLFTTDLNGIINDVRTDIWPEVSGVKCDNNSGNLVYTSDPDALPGRNRDCIFIGKAIHLGVGNGTLTVSGEALNYAEHTLIGLASDNENGPEKFQIFQNPNPPAFDTSKTRIVPHGGTITRVYQYVPTIPPPAYTNHNHPSIPLSDFIYLDGFAILLADFGEIEDTTTGDVLGGSRRISIWAIHTPNSSGLNSQHNVGRLRVETSDFITNTAGHNQGTPPFQYYHEINTPIYICLDSGLDDKAFIKIGSSQGSITAVVEQGEAVKNTLCIL